MTSLNRSIKNIFHLRKKRLELDSELLDIDKKQPGRGSLVDEILISGEGRKKYIPRNIGSQLIKLLFKKTP